MDGEGVHLAELRPQRTGREARMGVEADQLEKIRQGIRPDRVPQPEGVQHGKHQQPQPGRAGRGFPQRRFRLPVPARQCLQMPVDAAFRAANQLSQCAQALFALGGDSGENGTTGRPDGLSRRVFLSWSERIQGYGNPFPSPLIWRPYFNISVPA